MSTRSKKRATARRRATPGKKKPASKRRPRKDRKPPKRQPSQPESTAAEANEAGADLAQVRELLLQLHQEGKAEELVGVVLSILSQLRQRNAELELKVLKLLRTGRQSEKVSADQLKLMFEALGETDEQASNNEEQADSLEEEEKGVAEEADQCTPESVAPPTKKPKRRPRRLRIPPELPREEIRLDIPESERHCASCDKDKAHIGDEVSEILEMIPVQFFVKRFVRPKYACSTCKDGVSVAPPATKPIDGGIPGTMLLAHVAVSKYDDHMPLHRLSRRYEQSGARIPVSTMAGWVAHVAADLRPLWLLLQERVLAADVLQTDGTGIKVLDHDDPQGVRKGTMWCHVGDRRDVVFLYTPTGHARDGPWTFLADRSGYVHADAANTYDRIYNGKVANAIEVACWSHTRRKFHALKDSDMRVAWPLRCIRLLYVVEREAERCQLPPEAHLELRRRISTKQLDRLERWFAKTMKTEPPTSALGKAIAYAINQWTALNRFMDDARLELDTNRVERQIRSLAIGRRNYLFAGSDAGAESAAIIYSVLRSCHLHGVKPMEYLPEVMTKLAGGWPQSRIDELLPGRWAEARALPLPIPRSGYPFSAGAHIEPVASSPPP